MEGLEHDEVYGDSLSESIEQELTPAIAEALMAAEPLTQRRKRNLLVETTVAIERRELFLAELEEERDALETFADELADIESWIDRLPEYSPQEQCLEELLEVWEEYNVLKDRCERLIEHRQEQIKAAERSVRIFGDQHALNEYLYGEMDTSYPVLSATADSVERIKANREGANLSELLDRSL